MYWQSLNMHKFIELKEQVRAVVLPIGMTEAHGPHCPLGTDTIIPGELCYRLEEELGSEVIIAPAVPYGHSWSLAIFPGTVDIPAGAFTEYVLAIGRGFIRNGFSRIVLFNGHGGNIPSLTTVAETLADEGAAVLLINWWLDYSKEILEVCAAQGHAGEDETSVVMAIVPDLVDMNVATYNTTKRGPNIKSSALRAEVFKNALTGDGTAGTAEKGRRVLDRISPLINGLIKEFLDS